jgi:hypothetical protein
MAIRPGTRTDGGTMKSEKRVLNLWEMTPNRRAEWVTADNGLVVVLVPKFRNPLLVKWLMPRLAKPHFRIQLDDIGSAIWRGCDGRTTVGIIAGRLEQEFGERVRPVEDRLQKFFHQLERGSLLALESGNQQESTTN